MDYVVSNDRMTDELEKIWKGVYVNLSRSYPGICVEGLRKIMKKLQS
jgi:hypothetical protein